MGHWTVWSHQRLQPRSMCFEFPKDGACSLEATAAQGKAALGGSRISDTRKLANYPHFLFSQQLLLPARHLLVPCGALTKGTSRKAHSFVSTRTCCVQQREEPQHREKQCWEALGSLCPSRQQAPSTQICKRAKEGKRGRGMEGGRRGQE